MNLQRLWSRGHVSTPLLLFRFPKYLRRFMQNYVHFFLNNRNLLKWGAHWDKNLVNQRHANVLGSCGPVCGLAVLEFLQVGNL